MDAAWRDGTKVGVRLALAHHPLCREFHVDGMHPGGVRVCAGCAWAVPGFLVGLALAIPALLWLGANPWAVGAAGLPLGLPQLSTYIYRGSRAYRAASKAIGGVGLGLLLAGGGLAPVPAEGKIAAATLLALAFIGLQGLRMRSILRTCRACPWRADWDRCPGFRPDSRWVDPPVAT